MQHLAPVSAEEAELKALPILMAGYLRRGRRRSARERALRAAVKLERDDRRCQPPRICAL